MKIFGSADSNTSPIVVISAPCIPGSPMQIRIDSSSKSSTGKGIERLILSYLLGKFNLPMSVSFATISETAVGELGRVFLREEVSKVTVFRPSSKLLTVGWGKN